MLQNMNVILGAQNHDKKLSDSGLCILASLLVKERGFSYYLPLRELLNHSLKRSAQFKGIFSIWHFVVEVAFVVPRIHYLLILQVVNYI